MKIQENYPRQPSCSRGGCSRESNGVAPFHYCASHYASYKAWLAARERLKDALTYDETEKLRERLEARGVSDGPLRMHSEAIAERVDEALTLMCQVAADSIYRR